MMPLISYRLFPFKDTATSGIYTLSLHDALPISRRAGCGRAVVELDELELDGVGAVRDRDRIRHLQDRKSTRLNSSHQIISYAVFCLKKKKDPRSIIPRPTFYAGSLIQATNEAYF